MEGICKILRRWSSGMSPAATAGADDHAEMLQNIGLARRGRDTKCFILSLGKCGVSRTATAPQLSARSDAARGRRWPRGGWYLIKVHGVFGPDSWDSVRLAILKGTLGMTEELWAYHLGPKDIKLLRAHRSSTGWDRQ